MARDKPREDIDLSDQVALVTGAARGLGPASSPTLLGWFALR